MKVYVYPADKQGCGYYRLIWPGKILQAAGHNVQLVDPDLKSKLSGGQDASGRVVQMKVPADADVIVFQRVTSARLVEGIEVLTANGIAVVIDIDDDLSAIDPDHPAWATLHPNSVGRWAEYNWDATLRACQVATMVTVSTDALAARYGAHGRVAVLRNAVPEVFLDETRFPRVDSGEVAWAGALFSHPNDPQVTGASMARLTREGIPFRIVGDGKGTRRAFRLDADPPATGPIPVERWPIEVNRIGVGIAPLDDSTFNAAKSWLKPLEYAALGVPCVMSSRAEYRRIHALGVGELADSPRDWYRMVGELARDPSRREEMSQAGRAAVADLTIQRQAWRWWEAWDRAYQMTHDPFGRRIVRSDRPGQSTPGADLATQAGVQTA